MSYEQREARTLPPFTLYEQGAPPALPRFTPDESVRIGALAFLGYTSAALPAHPGQIVELETWWRVESLPGRPLSIMLHLTGPGDALVVVGDGLGVPVEQWRVGDVIVQRHRLELPSDAPAGEYRLLTGAYWLDDIERWPVLSGDQAGADTLILPPITVQPYAGNH